MNGKIGKPQQTSGSVNRPIQTYKYYGEETSTTITEIDNESPVKTIKVYLKEIQLDSSIEEGTLALQLKDSEGNNLSNKIEVEISDPEVSQIKEDIEELKETTSQQTEDIEKVDEKVDNIHLYRHLLRFKGYHDNTYGLYTEIINQSPAPFTTETFVSYVSNLVGKGNPYPFIFSEPYPFNDSTRIGMGQVFNLDVRVYGDSQISPAWGSFYCWENFSGGVLPKNMQGVLQVTTDTVVQLL